MRKLFTLFVFTLFALLSVSAVTITKQTWEDGSTGITSATELTTISTKITYTSETLDSAYLLVASKDSWGTYWIQQPIAFPAAATATEISFSFQVRAYSTVENSSRFRCWIGPTATSIWGDKLSAGIFGDILEANAGPVVEEATKMVTDKHSDTATPPGGVYAPGDSVTLSVSYNSNKVTTFFVRFKSKDNVTKFIEHDQSLPVTSADTVYSFKIKIPAETLPYDSMRIVGWIGNWSADKELETFINVSGDPVGPIEHLVSLHTEKHNGTATPVGGAYMPGDTITFTASYNSNSNSVLSFALKSKESNFKTLIAPKDTLSVPNTEGASTYEFEYILPDTVSFTGDCRISAYIGSWVQGEDVFEYIYVGDMSNVVEEATMMVSDKHDDDATPAGGEYEAGDTVTLSVTYNSIAEADYTIAFKTTDNATLFFKNIVQLPATIEETVYDVKIEIPANTAAYDSMMIVAWIGNYGGDKRLYEYIDVVEAAAIFAPKATSLNVYPNPSTGLLNIEATSEASLRMIDLNGKTVYQQSLLSGINKIDVSSFDRGIYFLSIMENNQRKTAKVVLR